MSMDKEYISLAAQAVQKVIPDNHGFILLVFNFDGGRMGYTSNAVRADCIRAMKEFIIKNGEEETWMKHVK